MDLISHERHDLESRREGRVNESAADVARRASDNDAPGRYVRRHLPVAFEVEANALAGDHLRRLDHEIIPDAEEVDLLHLWLHEWPAEHEVRECHLDLVEAGTGTQRSRAR